MQVHTVCRLIHLSGNMQYYQKVLFKVDVHLLSSSVSRNVDSWEANYVLVVTQHTGGSEGIITSCVVIIIHAISCLTT